MSRFVCAHLNFRLHLPVASSSYAGRASAAFAALMIFFSTVFGSRPIIGLLGGGVMLFRAADAAMAQGSYEINEESTQIDSQKADGKCSKAIDESKLTFPLVLASFL